MGERVQCLSVLHLPKPGKSGLGAQEPVSDVTEGPTLDPDSDLLQIYLTIWWARGHCSDSLLTIKPGGWWESPGWGLIRELIGLETVSTIRPFIEMFYLTRLIWRLLFSEHTLYVVRNTKYIHSVNPTQYRSCCSRCFKFINLLWNRTENWCWYKWESMSQISCIISLQRLKPSHMQANLNWWIWPIQNLIKGSDSCLGVYCQHTFHPGIIKPACLPARGKSGYFLRQLVLSSSGHFLMERRGQQVGSQHSSVHILYRTRRLKITASASLGCR